MDHHPRNLHKSHSTAFKLNLWFYNLFMLMSIAIGIIGCFFLASSVRDTHEKSRIRGNKPANTSCTIYALHKTEHSCQFHSLNDPNYEEIMNGQRKMDYEWKDSFPELKLVPGMVCFLLLIVFQWETTRRCSICVNELRNRDWAMKLLHNRPGDEIDLVLSTIERRDDGMNKKLVWVQSILLAFLNAFICVFVIFSIATGKIFSRRLVHPIPVIVVSMILPMLLWSFTIVFYYTLTASIWIVRLYLRRNEARSLAADVAMLRLDDM